MEEDDFNPENVRKKSVAAAGLCAWVINIVKWYINVMLETACLKIWFNQKRLFVKLILCESEGKISSKNLKIVRHFSHLKC